MYGLKQDWMLDGLAREFVLDDYASGVPRWCPGCGDHAALNAVHRLCRDEQLVPEKTVVVSGIGCASRFPHYMRTYGFHGLHGRALPVACGVKSRRPDLDVFVVTGDGDCTAIGAGHWVHAIRYNMKMVILLMDNNIYGLTKNQTSPTTPKGGTSNTHPDGSTLSPLNPLSVTLGITNASFVAQTVDWNPAHVYQTIKAAHAHPGLAFVRVLQRCPHFMPGHWDPYMNDPTKVQLLTHPDGVGVDDGLKRLFKNQRVHDPRDLAAARVLVEQVAEVPIGLLYVNPAAERYDFDTARGVGLSTAARRTAVQAEVDRFLI